MANMQQFSIKNDQAVELLESLTKRTGKGKTAVVVAALKAYEKQLGRAPNAARSIAFFEEKVHPTVKPEFLGKALSKEKLEEDLGMP